MRRTGRPRTRETTRSLACQPTGAALVLVSERCDRRAMTESRRNPLLPGGGGMIRWATALGVGLLVMVGLGSGLAHGQTAPQPPVARRGGWDGGSPFMFRAVLRGVGLTDS